jgi:hypothetical protein
LNKAVVSASEIRGNFCSEFRRHPARRLFPAQAGRGAPQLGGLSWIYKITKSAGMIAHSGCV